MDLFGTDEPQASNPQVTDPKSFPPADSEVKVVTPQTVRRGTSTVDVRAALADPTVQEIMRGIVAEALRRHQDAQPAPASLGGGSVFKATLAHQDHPGRVIHDASGFHKLVPMDLENEDSSHHIDLRDGEVYNADGKRMGYMLRLEAAPREEAVA